MIMMTIIIIIIIKNIIIVVLVIVIIVVVVVVVDITVIVVIVIVTCQSWEVDEGRETVTLQLSRSLEKGQRYDVHLAFHAPLTARFQAVYYSSYRENGHTK